MHEFKALLAVEHEAGGTYCKRLTLAWPCHKGQLAASTSYLLLDGLGFKFSA